MRYILSLFFACIALTLSASNTLTILDSNDKSAIAAASVFGRGGNIIGLTDNDGSISGFSDRDLPLTVRCLGYKPMTVNNLSTGIYMEPDNYELGEFVVTPLDRPILRIVCYIREYTGGVTSSDTIQTFAEHMADFYIPTSKVKNFKAKTSPRILKSILFERSASKDGRDSVYSPDFRRDDISWFGLMSLPKETVKETEAIANGVRTDSISGKYTVKSLYRKTDAAYITITDYLADKKGHSWSPGVFKLLGFTVDLNKMVESWAYRANDKGDYRPADLLYGTFSLDMTGRGKWIKKAFHTDRPVQMNALFEIYPVALEHLTIEEAKEQQRNAPRTKFERSPLAAPLPPVARAMVERVRAISK